MDNIQAGNFIKYLDNKWRIGKALDMGWLLDILYRGAPQSRSCYYTFEFSLVSKDKSLRLLHLNFYNHSTNDLMLDILKKRATSISRIIKYIKSTSGYKYDATIMRRIFTLSSDFLLPVQFGIVLDNKGVQAIKLYLSIVNQNVKQVILFASLCRLLDLKQQRLKRCFTNMHLDAIGIDFLPDCSFALKIYACQSEPVDLDYIASIYGRQLKRRDKLLRPFMSLIEEISTKEVGFLWRVSGDSQIGSIKIWARLRESIPFAALPHPAMVKGTSLGTWLESAGSIINRVKGRVSYLTLENEKPGIYFR